MFYYEFAKNPRWPTRWPPTDLMGHDFTLGTEKSGNYRYSGFQKSRLKKYIVFGCMGTPCSYPTICMGLKHATHSHK